MRDECEMSCEMSFVRGGDGGGEGEGGGSGCRAKNKNPTQRCGELYDKIVR